MILWYTDYGNEVARMNLIETKPVGETYFSHFAVDFSDTNIRLNGKQYPAGKITHEILCLSPEWVKTLFIRVMLCMSFASAGQAKDIPLNCSPKYRTAFLIYWTTSRMSRRLSF